MNGAVKDFRDAIILWLVADATMVLASICLAYSDVFRLPIMVSMIALSITVYACAAGFIVLAVASAITGWRKAVSR